MNIEKKLDKILKLYAGDCQKSIPVDVNLYEYLNMDSVTAMRILVDIETEFEFEFEDDELGIEIFETKKILLMLIERNVK